MDSAKRLLVVLAISKMMPDMNYECVHVYECPIYLASFSGEEITQRSPFQNDILAKSLGLHNSRNCELVSWTRRKIHVAFAANVTVNNRLLGMSSDVCSLNYGCIQM